MELTMVGIVFFQSPCVKSLITSLWHYWVMVEPSRGGVGGMKLEHQGRALEQCLFGSQPLPLSFSGYHEVSSFVLPCTPCHSVLPHHRPQSNRANHRLNLQNYELK